MNAQTKELTQLIVIEDTQALQIYTAAKGLDPIIEKIREEVKKFVPDVTTDKGRKEIASMAYKVAKSKTYLDNTGKALVDELKKKPKIIDAERSRVWDILEALQVEVRKPLTEWEETEERRVNELKNRMAAFDTYIGTNLQMSSFDIQKSIDELKLISIDDSWQEFKQEAQFKHADTLVKLNDMLTAATKREHDAAELARLQAAEQERLKADEEERLRREGEERARIEAEQAAQIEAQRVEDERKASEAREAALREEAEKAEREKQEAIDKANREAVEAAAKAERDKQAAIEAERKRIADEQEAERVAAEKREANKRHYAKINNKAMNCLIEGGIDADTAKQVIVLIASKKVENVVINY